MFTSTVTSKGQVTIPADIRHYLAIEQGDQVEFMREDDHIIIRRKEKDITKLFGVLTAKHGVSLAEMEKAIQARGKE